MRPTLEALTATYRSVIFDFDGTLFFLDVDWTGLKHALSSKFDGFDFTRLSHGLSDLQSQKGDILAAEAYRIVHRFETARPPVPNEPMLKLAQLCHDRGQKLAIFSANTRATIESILIQNRLDRVFDAVVSGDSVRMRKPHPEGLVTAISVIGGRTRDTVYIADGPAEMETGRRAEVRTIVLDAA